MSEDYEATYAWPLRQKAKTRQEALRFIARRTQIIIWDYSELSDQKKAIKHIKDVEEYAKEWSIPYSVDLFSAFLDDKEDFAMVWDSSEATC